MKSEAIQLYPSVWEIGVKNISFLDIVKHWKLRYSAFLGAKWYY